MNNRVGIALMDVTMAALPILRLAEAADHLLAGLDNGSIDPAAVALADALDEWASALPDITPPMATAQRFAAVLDLIGQPSASPGKVARLLADACESVTGEGSDPKVDPAVRVMLQHLIWLLGQPTDEDDYVIALQDCLDRSMAAS